jgi:putative alpha-1,2-mannosidase
LEEIFMDVKVTFVATLLGCTMLAGCDDSNDTTKNAPAATGTFGTVAAEPNNAVTPAGVSKADLDALKQDNATALNSVSVVQDAKLDSLKQDGAKELEALDAKRTAELEALRQDNAAALNALDAKNAAELDTLRQDNASTLTALEAKYAAEFDAHKQDNAAALASLDAKHASDLDALKKDNAAALASLDAKHADALDALKQSNATALKSLEVKYDSELDALKRDGAVASAANSAMAAALADAQKALEALQVRADADHKKAIALTLWKMSSTDVPAVASKLPTAQANRATLAAMQPGIDKLVADIAALQATPGLSDDTQAKLGALLTQAKTLKTDYAAATKPDGDIAKVFSDTDALMAALAAAANDPEASAALAEQLAATPQALDNVTKQLSSSSADFTTRLAALNDSLDFLRPRSDVALTQFVNPFIGTANSNSGFSGNLNPGAQLPFGGVLFSPSMAHSGTYNGSGGYIYSSTTIPYFVMTHLNGPGCTNQGAVAMLPRTAATAISSGSGEPFSHTGGEAAEPGYYKVKFNNGITSELTATTRTGMARFTYASKDAAFLLLDARLNDSFRSGVPASMVDMTLGADNQSISGKTMNAAFCSPWGGSWNQPVYFYATFDKPLKPATATVNTVANNAVALQFDLQDTDKTVQVKIGISSVSAANAKTNLLGDGAGLTGENTGWTFDDVRKQASAVWNTRLNTIQIDLAKGNPATLTAPQLNKLTQFYTALYRVYGGPSVYSDLNGEYRSFKQAKNPDGTFPPAAGSTAQAIQDRPTANIADYPFTGADGSIGKYKTHYTAFSLWDTYRSQAQLLALSSPAEASDMMQSLVADAVQCGAFPHWVDGSEDNTPMFGDNALNVVAGSYAFGARNFDLVKTAGLFKKETFDPTSACNNKASIGSGPSVLTNYANYGYIASGADDHASSATLEMITQDRSAAAFLKSLPTTTLSASGVTSDDIAKLYARASNWTNIFDDSTKSLKARLAGTLDATAGYVKGALTSGGFHESTEPNYFWSFAQDWTALINKLGTDRTAAKAAAMTRLNALFSLNLTLTNTEPTASQLNGGESSNTYYAGNEMNFSSPWAYNWAGSPKHAQYIIPTILAKTFSNDSSGLPGNDDLGALSAFYVWASLGLYPVIPSEAGLAISTPQFDGMTMWLGNGKKLRLKTGGQQALIDNVRYIADMKLNNMAYQGTWLPLDKIKDGGLLTYTLSKTPTEWGAGEALTPPSGPSADYSQPTATPPPPAVQMIQ